MNEFNTSWNPTPEQFATYQAKDLEHAKKNVDARNPTANLHSRFTVEKVLRTE